MVSKENIIGKLSPEIINKNKVIPLKVEITDGDPAKRMNFQSNDTTGFNENSDSVDDEKSNIQVTEIQVVEGVQAKVIDYEIVESLIEIKSLTCNKLEDNGRGTDVNNIEHHFPMVYFRENKHTKE